MVISENDGNQLGYYGGAKGVERSGLVRLQLDSHAVADLYTLIHSGYFTMVISENDENQLGFFRGCMGRR